MRNASASAANPAPGEREAVLSAFGPISDTEFSDLLAEADPDLAGMPPSLFLAGVSGGADSTALSFLLSRWCRARGHAFRAIIVDHGLRSEAAEEAGRVAARLGVVGICAEILRWTGPKPGSGIQAAARAARFGLMIERAVELGASALFLAHHLQDQAETMVMRLGRESGADGLAGIRPRQMRAGVRVMRPLLPVSPERLRLTCLAGGLSWVEDPSNRDRRFERIRIREEQDGLEAVGLGAGRLSRMAQIFSRLRDWSDDRLAGFLTDHAVLDRRGFARLNAEAVAGLPRPLRLKLASGLLQSIGGGAYPPRRESLERLDVWVTEGRRRRVTLGGCLIWRSGAGEIWIAREVPRKPRPEVLRARGGLRWDGRFDVTWQGDRPAWVHMLTRDGERRLRRLITPAGLEIGLPQSVRCSLPVVTDLDGRLFAPHFCETWTGAPRSNDGSLQVEFRPAVPWVAQAYRSGRDDRVGVRD
ncbi:tRNA lysidine(34) synthetase TilS [Nisaea acidiphila]|uniref:tRNA(Ile)-lysidine synthase n=1 Tax=Nisaea acidiphila TaxID=1862145 RepID=A0A9J7AMA9_9PROT|nr:tRNA lysidine(34) synthetase TilS [Nisaea acidiphila]UUX48779.1 tRNA lysidine(34) synthetase TilS [Nisaea acidiphila]